MNEVRLSADAEELLNIVRFLGCGMCADDGRLLFGDVSVSLTAELHQHESELVAWFDFMTERYRPIFEERTASQ